MLRLGLGLELGEIASGREGGHHGGGLVLGRRRAVRVSIRGRGSGLPGFVLGRFLVSERGTDLAWLPV